MLSAARGDEDNATAARAVDNLSAPAQLRQSAGARPRLTNVALCVAVLGLTGALTIIGVSKHHDQAPRPAGALASLRRIGGAHAELIVSGMHQPPIGEIYEVWLKRAGSPPQPTDALFTVTRTGHGTVEVPGTLKGVREVLVSSEPLGGSARPTSPAVFRIAVPHAQS